MGQANMRVFLSSTVAIFALLALSACGGGGGGGGPTAQNPTPTPTQPTPLPMPPATVAGDCTGSPGQVACLSMRTNLTGPWAALAASTNQGLRNTLQAGPGGINVTFVPNGPGTADDAYEVTGTDLFGTSYAALYPFLQSGSDPLGNFRRSGQFFVLDVSTALSGSLDYVQLVAQERGTVAAADLAFVVLGRQTAAADMPTSGTAQYAGGSRGTYLTAGGEFFTTASDVTLSANFGSGSVTGSASNFRFMTQNGVRTTRPERLDFGFTASIAAGSPRFSGTASSSGGLGLSGRVEGAFFGGPGRTPEEAGFAYQLGTPGQGAFMNGGAALGRSQ